MESKYYLKVTNGIVHVQLVYLDKDEPKEHCRYKVKNLIIGKLGEPFFEPTEWVKKLLK